MPRLHLTPVKTERARDLEAEVDRLRNSVRGGALSSLEQRALEALYMRYHALVRESVYPLLASSADADDVTQTVFVGLPRALQSYKSGNFEGWLRRVAVRFALMSIRARRRASTREERSFNAIQTDLSVDACWNTALMGEGDPDLDRQYAGVRRAFYALPDPIREVVFLRAIVELSHAEIADWLGITTGACYTRYCRGLAQLRGALDGHCD